MKHSDVIVCGGGVIGLSIAWRLAQHKVRVTLIDQRLPGMEASFAAAGMILPYGESEEPDDFFRLCLESARRYPKFVAELESLARVRTGYSHAGVLYPVWNAREEREIQRRLDWQEAYGLSYQRLSGRELARRFPGFHPGLRGGFHVRSESQVDNRWLALALARAGKRAGVRFFARTEVRRLTLARGRCTGVETSKGRYEAGWVVNAAGSWAGQSPFRVPSFDIPVKPIRGQRVNLTAGPDVKRFFPRCVIFAHGCCYLVPRWGTLIAGSTEDDAGFTKAVTAGAAHTILGNVLKIFPAVEKFRVDSVESGLRPCTPDKQPILGTTPLPGYLIAAGHFRKGILLTPVTGDEISALILRGGPSELIRSFNVGRFDQVKSKR